MTDKDNITLPREVVEKIHEAWSSEVYPPATSTEWYDIMDALRTALAAEQPKPEPVAWLSRDEARLALWKAINSREFGNPTDDKLILDHLRQQGLWIGKVTSPVPPEDEALRRDAERYEWAVENAVIETDRFRHDGNDPCSTKRVLDAAIDAAMKEDKT